MSLPPPQPPAYGAAPYGQRPSAEHPNGTTILVLGILSLVVCGVLGPISWVMGNTAVREMNANPAVDYRNRGNVTAGRVCGIIGSVLLALQIVAFGFMVIVFAASGS
jgi:hypothetical protein